MSVAIVTEQPSRNQKESHRRDAENAEVPSPGAHASSVPRVPDILHPGCVRSQGKRSGDPSWQSCLLGKTVADTVEATSQLMNPASQRRA